MRLVIAITGASGAIYGINLLKELKKKNIETHLIISKWGEVTIESETDYSIEKVKSLADYFYGQYDLAAQISSGSFKTNGMIIIPCSMKTLSSIANGYTEDIISRAADVCIKEHRKLSLVVRESPLSPIHIKNMLKLSKIGVTIMPPVPAFYTRPKTIEDIVSNTVGRVLEQFGVEMESLKRWGAN